MNICFDFTQGTADDEQKLYSQPKNTNRSINKNNIAKKKINKKKNKKHTNMWWKQKQQKRYTDFLKVNKQSFKLSIQERKKITINKLMSKAVRTRTPSQCHSHHQKMMEKFRTIQGIIENAQNQDFFKLLTFKDSESKQNIQQNEMLIDPSNFFQ